MREVGGPRHVVDSYLVPNGDAAAIDAEGGARVIAEVVRGHLLQLRPGPDAVPPPTVVGHLGEMRDPAHAGLDGGHPKPRKAVEHPLEYQLGDEWHRER